MTGISLYQSRVIIDYLLLLFFYSKMKNIILIGLTGLVIMLITCGLLITVVIICQVLMELSTNLISYDFESLYQELIDILLQLLNNRD